MKEIEIGDIVVHSSSDNYTSSVHGLVTQVVGLSKSSAIILDDNSGSFIRDILTPNARKVYNLDDRYLDNQGWTTSIKALEIADIVQEIQFMNKNHLSDCACFICQKK